MPVVPSLLGYRASNVSKGVSRSKSAQRALPSKSLRISTNNQQTRIKRTNNRMNNITNSFSDPPRPPDPTLFVQAGTSGLRHLFPIHLMDSDGNLNAFPRSISRLRSRVPTTERCTNIEMIRNICLSIQTLEHFDISENNLDDLPLDIACLTILQTLNCSHNQLSTIPDLLEKLIHLKDLDISFNQFKQFPAVICRFTHLIRFNCEHNFLKTIHDDVINLINLKTMILDHNQLENLDTIDFSHLKELEYIHIAHNQLLRFPSNLHQLTHLKNINLSYNQLTTFPTELFLINTLDVVNLSHNFLTHLSSLPDVYKRTSLIFSIDLSFNQLTRFYDYLLWISIKLDLSNNGIEMIPKDVLRRINRDTLKNRELKIDNNPLKHPIDLISKDNINTNNLLRIIRNHHDEQQIDESIRQGFKICITGSQQTGKSSLAFCLEELLPCVFDKKPERMMNILHFPFRFQTRSRQESLPVAEINAPKQKKSSNLLRKRSAVAPVSQPSSAPPEPIKTLPVTIFDFSGSPRYYEHMTSVIDTNAIYLICIHTVQFEQTTPMNIEEIFDSTFDIRAHSVLAPLFQILQFLCEKVTKTNGLVIIPVATHIDLYDKRPTQEKNQALDKINQFFKLYHQHRFNRIRDEIQRINSLSIVSASLSYRLKVYTSLLDNKIQIESCQPISSLTCQGLAELNQTIQNCLLTHQNIFPHVDRMLPSLWVDTNHSIESLADQLAVPYVSWENFTNYITTKHGLSNLIDDIAMSLCAEGKILILNQIGTSDRVVFLRPLWLGDLLTSLLHLNDQSKSNHQPHIKEYHQFGRLHSDLVRALWHNLVHKKEEFYQVWMILMRFLLIAYPKMSKKQLKSLLHTEGKHDFKFDYAIVPYCLPVLNFSEQDKRRNAFYHDSKYTVSVCYQSRSLPLGFFHRYSVSAIFKLNITYVEHWNNFILGKYDEHDIKFILDTDHQTYINCYCATDINNQPFEQIWNVLMLILNHFEDLFKTLAPNNQFNRYVRCPYCKEYSFMGEWTTPKELQGLQCKKCTSCGEDVDTKYLVQPNESKRRNEDLLHKIRERKSTSTRLMTTLV
ncbi:unnamed protein product [Adineta ricciae]|uniref:Uncharacterized protein n=1 Tax=Adineta ricciae TaxID=249248 RepID=A0A814A3E6_ADIRI|nr:unnamed protein product [Adineta ricciae]CAF0908879.1 unnamed protein product [Adineta ricciae]